MSAGIRQTPRAAISVVGDWRDFGAETTGYFFSSQNADLETSVSPSVPSQLGGPFTLLVLHTAVFVFSNVNCCACIITDTADRPRWTTLLGPE